MVVGVSVSNRNMSARMAEESPFKGCRRHFCDRYRTLFYINVYFKWYIFQG